SGASPRHHGAGAPPAAHHGAGTGSRRWIMSMAIDARPRPSPPTPTVRSLSQAADRWQVGAAVVVRLEGRVSCRCRRHALRAGGGAGARPPGSGRDRRREGRRPADDAGVGGARGVAGPARPVVRAAGGAMSPLASSIAGLVLGALGVVVAGVVLARSSDVIAARTNLGRVWVGSIFLAAATSLPELVTDISAVRIGAGDLAAGDLLGSGMANMLILAAIALRPGAHLFRRAALDHTLSASLAIVLTGIAAIAIQLGPETAVLNFGPGSLLLLSTYLIGTRILFRHSTVMREAGVEAELTGSEAAAAAEGAERAMPSLRAAVVRFLAATAVIIVAAPVFASSAVRIAELTGIATSFIG